MSNKALNHVWEYSKQVGSALVLMLKIADMSNDDGGCYPGTTRLAKGVRVEERQVQKLVDKCETDGELAVVENGGVETGHGKTNHYWVLGLRYKHWSEVPNAREPRPPKPKPEKPAGGNGVSSETPQDTSPETPLGVSPETPKPSVEPKEEPKDSPPDGEGQKPSFEDFFDGDFPIPDHISEPERLRREKEEAERVEKTVMMDSILHVFGAGGKQAEKYYRMLTATTHKNDGEWRDYELSQPLTAVELREWHRYYLKFQQKNADEISMVKQPDLVNGYIEAWIALGKPPATPQPRSLAPLSPVLPSTSSPAAPRTSAPVDEDARKRAAVDAETRLQEARKRKGGTP